MAEKFKSKIMVAGRAVEYWGSQSISSDSSAIFELVKNARDADATKAEIIFENTDKEGGRIIIRDNGHGMTREEIDGSWLVAGTNFKLVNTKSKKGRRMWGEMGIGRFSCERLAKQTTMISLPDGKNEKIVMRFDWEKYKDPEITFDDVVHEGYIEKKNVPKEHGLELVLEGVKSKWSAAKIRSLRRELGSYILPPELKGPDDFEILISADGSDLKNEPVESSIIKIAPLRMRAEYNGKKMTVKILDVENETKKWHEREPVQDEEKTCGPFKFGLFFYPLDKSGETKWTKYYQDRLKDMEIRDFLGSHSGIYLYRDHVWIKPYGGSRDWLGLEGRRVQRRSKIGRTQVFGIVSISQDGNPGIKPTAHREVLQGTKEFEDLKSLIMGAVKDLENYRQESRVGSKSGKQGDTEEMAGNNISQIVKLCRTKESLRQGDVQKIAQYAAATKKYIERFKKEVEERSTESEEVRSHELNVMSVGLITSYVSHEVAAPLENTASILSDVRKTMDATDFSKALPTDAVKQVFGWLERLERNSEKLRHFISFVNELSTHIADSRTGNRGTSQIRMRDLWNTVLGGFNVVSEMSKITTEYVEHQKDLRIRFSRIDMESILSHLMANSIEALKKNKSGQGVIRFDTSYLKDGLQIKFSDSGKGIKFDDEEEIFEPFITTNKTGDDIVHGHGLGLSIAREILRRHDGTISAKSPGYLDRGSTFTIRIPSGKAKRVI